MTRSRPLVAGLMLLVVGALGACGREAAFEDRTAQVRLDGRTTTFAVDACVLDGQTAYVVGRAEDGSTVQAVVGVEPDGATGVPASTGVSVAGADETPGVAAFGPEAWARRGEEGPPPGSVSTARIRGSRIQAAGEVAVVGPDDRPVEDGTSPFSFDARCDERDDE